MFSDETFAQLTRTAETITTAWVMTEDALEELKKQTATKDVEPDGVTALLGRLEGMEVYAYPTMRECMDRMLAQQPGERLCLCMVGELPLECLTHPWYLQMKAQQMLESAEFGEKYGMPGF